MKKLALFFLSFGFIFICFSQEQRNLLQKEGERIGIENVLIKDFSELGYPTYKNRDFWNNIPDVIRKQYIEEAEKFLNYNWPVVKATDYLAIIRTGDRMQQVYAAPKEAVTALVMGELIEGKGRFTDQIINGCWYYSEQTWWGWSAHLKYQKAGHGLPDVHEPLLDLGVGEITNILSWTWFLFKDEFDKIHPLIAGRLKNEIMNKAVIPFYERDDFWWQGLAIPRQVNNWVPWVNYNMLNAILILEDNQQKRNEGVRRVLRGVDEYINQSPNDGGCDEGPSYWGRAGAMLYEDLYLLKKASNGKFDIYDDPLIKNLGTYIYKACINYPYFINFADADAITDSHPQIIYSYGKAIKDSTMQKFGAYIANQNGWGEVPPIGKIDRQIKQLQLLDEIGNFEEENALIDDFWLSDIEVAGARDKAGSTNGFFFSAKGGHNEENHNHNDVGSCVMYYNGKPCLIDLGREIYVAKTFSNQRYKIWTMQSQYHNAPKINGQDQMPGKEFMAKNTSFKADSNKADFSTDIAGAYPENAKVKKWVRSYVLERGKKFIIKDEYELAKTTNEPTTLNLITYSKVTELAPGTLHLEGEDFKLALSYNPKVVSPGLEFYEITDERLKRYWPVGVTRIVFEIRSTKLKDKNELIISEIE